MQKIITAMEKIKLNQDLKKEKNFEVICNNIQYREAIIDIIKKNKKNKIIIDVVIIDEKLPGEITFHDLIFNILKINNKIKIFFLIENDNSELKKELEKNKNKNIYLKKIINKEILLKELNEEKIEKNKNIKINSEEINNGKKIEKSEKKVEQYNFNNYSIFKINEEKNNLVDNETKKIIDKNYLILIGNNDYAKENFIYDFISIINKEKILIINFNIVNNKKENEIIKLNDNVDLIVARDNIYKKDIDIKKYISDFFMKYEFIFLDFNINNYLFLRNNFYENKNIIFFIDNSLEKIKAEFKKINKIIENKKIKIILNKIDKNYIDKNILNIILRKSKIIGIIKFDKRLNNKRLRKIYKKILK